MIKQSSKYENMKAENNLSSFFREAFAENKGMNFHRRYFKIAGITIILESELPFLDSTFLPKFKLFETDGPGEENINIRHYFSLPNLRIEDLGKKVYDVLPWTIFKHHDLWVYLGPTSQSARIGGCQMVLCNADHSQTLIFHPGDSVYSKGNHSALTLLPTDQIILARAVAMRKGCYLHSGGIKLNGRGYLFAGHSEAGKSTIVTLMKQTGKILCDDRMIVRNWRDRFKIYGTWGHGDVPEVSPESAPLSAIFFLKKALYNRILQIDNRIEIVKQLLAFLVKPFVTVDWWEKMLQMTENMIHEIPCYELYFDKSQKVVELLKNFDSALIINKGKKGEGF